MANKKSWRLFFNFFILE